MPDIAIKLKSQQLNSALRLAQQNTGKLPSHLANKACQYISLRAFQNMPKVDPSNIDQELEVSAHGVTAKGRLSRAKRPKHIQIGSHPSSLASRIVLASFYPGSPYNIRTGQVWFRQKPGTHGSADFWKWIADTAAQMVKARHSAAGFYAFCARAVNMGFFRVTRAANFPGAPAEITGGDPNKSTKLLSSGVAQIWPAVGESGKAKFSVSGSESDDRGNRNDLVRVALPVWQRAVDSETEAITKYAASAYAEQLRKAGFKVKTG